jgi:uncharacterized Rmd1/YagE family protein
MTKTQLSKMIGGLFMLRSSLNLMSDMLDTPDCFWDKEKMEDVYEIGKILFFR